MFQRASNGGSGGEKITAMDICSGQITISSSNTYTFAKNYKYVLVWTYGGASNLDTYRVNGVKPSYVSANGMMSYINTQYAQDLMLVENIKSGDILSSTGSLSTMIIGFE